MYVHVYVCVCVCVGGGVCVPANDTLNVVLHSLALYQYAHLSACVLRLYQALCFHLSVKQSVQ